MTPGQVYPEHDPIVLQAAREGIVLLKNDHHLLPLAKGSVVNAFGSGAAIFVLAASAQARSMHGTGFGLKRASGIIPA